MALQNRVTPAGELIAHPARGMFMGNRGGQIHHPETRTLTGRAYASRRWICCTLAFKGTRREVWGTGYTELFFLDEVTALSAGHRPCFECRRDAAKAFAAALAEAGVAPGAGGRDRRLHSERFGRGGRPTHQADLAALPDGTVILHEGGPHALRAGRLLPWSPSGWLPAAEQPRGGGATVLTPPTVLTALRNGYRPVWHASAG